MHIDLRSIPDDDGDFRMAAEAELAAGVRTPDELASRLRPRYPSVRAHASYLDGERPVRWYVYRDGRWVSATAW